MPRLHTWQASYGSRCIYVRKNGKISLETCYAKENGATNLYWTYSAEKQLVSQLEPAKCLTVSGGGGNADALKVTLEPCGAAQYQTWDFVPVW